MTSCSSTRASRTAACGRRRSRRSRPAGHRALAPDLPGFGDAPLEPGTIAYVDHVAALLDRPAAVVGCSFGGRIALELALAQARARRAARPDRRGARRVGVVGGGAGGLRRGGGGARPRRPRSRRGPAGADVARRRRRPRGARADRGDDAALLRATGAPRRAGGGGLAGAASAATRLGEIAVPTLVVVGTEDVDDIKAIAEKLATEIPGRAPGDDRGRRPPAEPRAPGRAQPAAARVPSLTTASESAGQAVFDHSPNSRSVRTTQARARRSGSTQRNVPEPPKWPNVRGEVSVPDQWPALPSFSSKPEPPVDRVEAAVVRQHAGQARERDRRRLGERLAARRASAQAAPARARPQSRKRPVDVRGRRAAELRAHPERPEDGLGEVPLERHLGARRDVRGERLEALVRVDPPLARPARSAGRRRKAGRSRARAGAGPSTPRARPARRGRPLPPPRRRASRARSRASSPRPSGRRGPRGRGARPTPSGRTTAAAACSAPQVVDLAEGFHGGRY